MDSGHRGNRHRNSTCRGRGNHRRRAARALRTRDLSLDFHPIETVFPDMEFDRRGRTSASIAASLSTLTTMLHTPITSYVCVFLSAADFLTTRHKNVAVAIDQVTIHVRPNSPSVYHFAVQGSAFSRNIKPDTQVWPGQIFREIQGFWTSGELVHTLQLSCSEQIPSVVNNRYLGTVNNGPVAYIRLSFTGQPTPFSLTLSSKIRRLRGVDETNIVQNLVMTASQVYSPVGLPDLRHVLTD